MKTMKAGLTQNTSLLLIEPPFERLFKESYTLDRYPLALGYLAATVRRETEWSVRCYNADFNPDSEWTKTAYLTGAGYRHYLDTVKDVGSPIWKEVKAAIQEFVPRVVGISVKSQTLASARVIARIAKETDPGVIVVVGGPHPSMVGSDVLACADFDVAVVGEGERTLVEFLTALGERREWDGLKGICYRRDGIPVANPPREYIEDLDTLPFPAEGAEEVLKDYADYQISAFRYIFAIRGCPYRCAFCGSHRIWGRRPRARTPSSIVKEIRELRTKGVRSISFEDDTFGVDRRYLEELCEALSAECPGLKWRCELHVNLVDDRTLTLMKAAGCVSISIGIESGNDRILKEIGKGITVFEAIRAADLIRKYRIRLSVFFMVGFPQETEETLRDTYRVMRRVRADVILFSIFTPYPGTEAFALCKEKGFFTDDYDPSLHYHQSPANYFCSAIPRDRFMRIVAQMEKMVDMKGWLDSVRRNLSSEIFWKIRNHGLVWVVRKVARLAAAK